MIMEMGVAKVHPSEQGLADMFRDGASNIATRKVDAKELEARELTAEEQAIITARVTHQQRMFAAFQKQDLARKVAHLQEVHEDISDAAARRALEECDGSEDAAAEALADTLFKHRMQVAAGDRVARPVVPRVVLTRSGGNNPSSRPVVMDPAALGGVFLGKFRGRGPLPIPGGPLIGAQGPVAMPISDAAAQRDESPATLADATADEPLVAEPSHSGHSSGGGCVSGSGGSAGTSVREHTPECAAAQPAGPAGESSQAEPSSRDSSPASADAGQGGAISPPAGGWRPARPRQRRPVRQAATDDAVNTQRTARSPQTRRQLALQQERWELEVALARSAAEVAQPAAAAEAASPALTAPAAPPLQPAQPAATPPLVPAVSAEVAAQLAPTDPPAAAGQNTADDAAAAQAAQATSASDDAAQQSKAPEATPAQEPSAAAAMSEPATGLLSDEETVSLVAVSDDDVDIGTTSALQGPMTRSGRTPQKGPPPPRRAGRAAARASASKPPQRQAQAAGGRRYGSGAISRNGGTVRGRVRQKSHKQAVLLQLGTLRAEAGWYNAGYIFPEGFASRVNFRSSVQLDQLVAHDCTIIGEGGTYWPLPTFRVVAADRPAEPLTAKSCTGCWTQVLKRICAEIEARRRAGEALPPPPKTAIAGPEYFGLNQPEIEEQIESLDPNDLCDLYWVGKGDRAAVAAGLPAAPPLPAAAAASRGGAGGLSTGLGRGRKKRRRGNDEDTDEEAGGGGLANKWSALSRNERYKTRCGADGVAAVDASNPLPERFDPITLEPVVSPAISPYGHVMGAATWKAVLAEKGKCPFTGQPLAWHQCTMLTHANIQRFRDRIRD